MSEYVELAAILVPPYTVAGDTFDYSVERHVVHVAVFDAMGHGLDASRMANLAVASYRLVRKEGGSLLDMAAAVDDVIAGLGPERFVTGQLATLDLGTGAVDMVSAGHPMPLLLRDTRVVGQVAIENGVPFGLETARRVTGELALEPGDRIVFLTDGMVETRSPGGEQFGIDRLADHLARAAAAAEPAAETLRRLAHDILAHGEGRMSDDATLLLLGWRSRRPAG
jgi:serine phosphatase RsbU (regulator of sigma subunit)